MSASPPAPARAPAPATRKPARDPWFDNAKFALVTLVVIGHMWTLLSDAGAKVWLYDFLYYWHVPAFVIVTGYLSRNFDYSHERLRALFRTVVVPYMVFELVLALFRVYVGHEDINDIWADPHWPMWYLAALFFWRLLTPPFRKASYAAIPIAVVDQPGRGHPRHRLARPRARAGPAAVLRDRHLAAQGALRGAPPALGARRGGRGARPDLRRGPVHRRLDQHRVALLPGPLRRARAARPPGDPDPLRADRDRHPRSVRVPVAPAAPADLVHQARRRHPRGLPVPRLRGEVAALRRASRSAATRTWACWCSRRSRYCWPRSCPGPR